MVHQDSMPCPSVPPPSVEEEVDTAEDLDGDVKVDEVLGESRGQTSDVVDATTSCCEKVDSHPDLTEDAKNFFT
jgi:hypothetical protein